MGEEKGTRLLLALLTGARTFLAPFLNCQKEDKGVK